MAPSATATLVAQAAEEPIQVPRYFGQYKEFAGFKYSQEREKELGVKAASYPNYLPTFNPEQKYPPLKSFEHYEHGKDADTTFPDLLPSLQSRVAHLTPTIGSEVRGIQLSSLNDAGKDQLARFVAERKVVAFRGQDFKDLPISEALKFGGYFGRHHIHPTSGSPGGYPEVHLVHRGAGDNTADQYRNRTNSIAWHSDVSYEQQPPGTTFLYVLDLPETGGDTLFCNAVEAYNRLSPLFKERLHGLKATHSGIEQVAVAVSKGSIKRREPVISAHPIVRTHPATGEKALWSTTTVTRDIIGMKKEESDAILKFLYDHIALGQDFQARVKWEPGTVVVWDNRVTQHSAIFDWQNGQRRHLARITPQAERPYETTFNPSE